MSASKVQYFSGSHLYIFPLRCQAVWCACHTFTCEIIPSDFFFSPLFPLVPWQLRVTVWSLCTKAVSYIKYPKACQKGQYENDIVLFILTWLMSVYVLPGVPGGRASGLSASACPMYHMPFFTLWRDPGYEAKLWSSLLTAVPRFSKWGILFITGLSAAWRKMIVHDSLHFPHAILCPSATRISSEPSYKNGHDSYIPLT